MKFIKSLIFTAGIVLSVASFADSKSLYTSKTCAACHGIDGKTPIMPLYPKIAGQSKEYSIAQMKDIKSGARSNGMSAAMKGIMAMVSDDEMAEIADWLSKQ